MFVVQNVAHKNIKRAADIKDSELDLPSNFFPVQNKHVYKQHIHRQAKIISVFLRTNIQKQEAQSPSKSKHTLSIAH